MLTHCRTSPVMNAYRLVRALVALAWKLTRAYPSRGSISDILRDRASLILHPVALRNPSNARFRGFAMRSIFRNSSTVGILLERSAYMSPLGTSLSYVRRLKFSLPMTDSQNTGRVERDSATVSGARPFPRSPSMRVLETAYGVVLSERTASNNASMDG